MKEIMSVEVISTKIYEIRGKKVMLDRDLAVLYGVETYMLKRQVKRNRERFPPDFMFQLTKKELKNLSCQIGISSWGGIRYLPYVFTEHGVAMLSSILNSKRAIRVNIQIMRAFVLLRRMLISYKDIRHKIEEIESNYDRQFAIVFEAIKQLLEPPKQTRAIGFRT